MIIRGAVERVIFRNESNGYTVLDIKTEGGVVTAAGALPSASEGETFDFSGEFKFNPKFGKQFAITGAEKRTPTDVEGIEKYLGGGLLKGVGPVTAERIVKKFGAESLNIIEFAAYRLAEVRGISRPKAAEIGRLYRENKETQNAVMFLQRYDISLNLAIRIFKTYGADTERAFRENPYRLAEDVDGVGFLTADKIAVKLGIPPDSPRRLRAALAYILETAASQNGHTYLPYGELTAAARKLLGASADEGLYGETLREMRIDGLVKSLSGDGGEGAGERIALSRVYAAERSAAGRLFRLKNECSRISGDVSGEIAAYEKREGIALADKQRDAVAACVDGGVTVITGGPGTGKTTILKCVLRTLGALGLKAELCAPTGRAAKKLSLAAGVPARTVHRLLETAYGKNSRGARFLRDEKNPLEADAIIADETSMMDVFLMSSLLRAVRPGARLILVGDKDQLPSVGPGNILADVIASGVIPVVKLDTIYRQAEKSLIVVNAHRINRGQMPDLDRNDGDFFFSERAGGADILKTTVDMCARRIPAYLNVSPQTVQVIAPMRGGVCGVENLNVRLQEAINPPAPEKAETEFETARFRRGDKVIQTVNNYDKEWTRLSGFEEAGAGVFNGDIGVIEEIEDGAPLVRFEDDRRARYSAAELNQLSPAYAVTVHKSQGCEFDAVVIPVVPGNYMLLTRNLLYTAVTRAKNMAVLVGRREDVSRMVNNTFTAKRYTMLKELLREVEEKGGAIFSPEG